ncbi:MAG TPA: ferrous iron transport protein B [Candidatus Methanoperedens sp.]|nr:ferrous iron transport protein B [Candidatus Methanoperedens sp.]
MAKEASGVHDQGKPAVLQGPTVVLVGQPNVGKSVIFGRLTGKYAVVSNYPGTTVEVTTGHVTVGDRRFTVIDTPGVNSIHPHSEDERVTRDILLEREPDVIVQVADAKNLTRALSLTSQLIELGRPLVLCLNMSDEAEQAGVHIDARALSELLGVEVVRTIAPEGEGLAALRGALVTARAGRPLVTYGRVIEERLARIAALLPRHRGAARGLGLMFLAGEPGLEAWAERTYGPETLSSVRAVAAEAAARLVQPPEMVILKTRRARVQIVVARHLRQAARGRSRVAETLGRWTREPASGIPIFLGVMFGLYYLVGTVGAGIFVDFLENAVFGAWVNPAAVRLFAHLPWAFVQRLFAGDYGLITMGLTYGIAIVLPIVGTFFFAFGLLEDSGYLPRLAIMSNRLFRVIGLNGKAILPMVLGLGCDTMATMTARILESRKERFIVTLLLALGVPCSAQLGVILGLASYVSPAGFAVVIGAVAGSMLLVGYFASRLVPGAPSDFIFEIPPLRLPRVGNILLKTWMRVVWFLREAIPLFLLGTLALFLAAESGLLALAERGLAPLIQGWLSLPAETTRVFILGFLRRDYGAAGLFALATATPPALSVNQTVVALSVITLFVPCVANFLVIIKEQGLKRALAILGFITPFSFFVGGLINWTLRLLHISL